MVLPDAMHYRSRNLDVFISPDNPMVETREEKSTKLHFVGDKIALSSYHGDEGVVSTLEISKEASDELRSTVERIVKLMIEMYNSNQILGLKHSVDIYPNYIHHQSGHEILAATNGLSYLTTLRGVVLQITPNSIKVKDLDGKIKTMDTSKLREGLKALSHAISEEAKDWMSDPDLKHSD